MTDKPATPFAVEQVDQDAERAEQFGKDFRAEQERNYGCGGVVECCFPMDGNCACFNTVLETTRHAAEKAALEKAAALVEAVEAIRVTHRLISDFAPSGFTDPEIGMQLFTTQGRLHAILASVGKDG